MRKAWLAMALLAAGCSKENPSQQQMADVQSYAQANGNEAAGADVHATLIPGVALTYAYSFLLPVAAVSVTQEKHAMQCEAMGPARCRIIGMQYHVIRPRMVQATLALKLSPELARKFGKDGIGTVLAAGGMLQDAQVDSVDAGTVVAASNGDRASMDAEQKRLTNELNKRGLGDQERMQLQSQWATLEAAKRAAAASTASAQAQLAATPVTFSYQSGVVDTGFNDGPFVGALKDGWANIVAGTLVILTLAITLIPWIVVVLLLVWLWRRYGRRIGLGPRED